MCLDVGAAFEICNGACYFENSVVCTRRKFKALHGGFHQRDAAFINSANGLEEFAVHLSIAMDFFAFVVAVFLNFSRSDYSLSNVFAGFTVASFAELIETYGGHFDMNVYSVEQRTANFIEVFLYDSGPA